MVMNECAKEKIRVKAGNTACKFKEEEIGQKYKNATRVYEETNT